MFSFDFLKKTNKPPIPYELMMSEYFLRFVSKKLDIVEFNLYYLVLYKFSGQFGIVKIVIRR